MAVHTPVTPTNPHTPHPEWRTHVSLPRSLSRLTVPAVALALAASLSACGSGDASTTGGRPDNAVAAQAQRSTPPDGRGTAQAKSVPGGGRAESNTAAVPTPLPGVGPRTLARIPGKTRQVVLVTGRGKNSSVSEAVLYRRTEAGWEPGKTWPAHNAVEGWTDDHRLGDHRSPIGVFTLTDAGGLLPDPGTRLPYDQSTGFTINGTGSLGEPLAGSFDYVIAIDYNRKPGVSPLDWTRPLGAEKGGGIWLHVDHEGPTQGCVSLRKRHMRELLLALDPGQHPVIVMGDAESLRR
ncbi:L,D-transpeptidase family protein [Streptomyces chromofuscus]|uniref:L,D-transpeptidase family protein n=1 Tax=Streptomyces chromofuscus TaxID=42881 RepID=UPI001D1516F2|nr:L,D-transpeptidase family protein [Streptomyces chromofuscus]